MVVASYLLQLRLAVISPYKPLTCLQHTASVSHTNHHDRSASSMRFERAFDVDAADSVELL